MSRRKIFISIGIITYLLICITLAVLLFTVHKSNMAYNIEMLRSQSYKEITEDDYVVDDCEYVKFNAFFTRDLDNDGYAEKYDGTCNYLDKNPTLYFDINVLTNGRLENGKITINGKNFDLKTTLIKDEVLKKDYIGEVSEIELNTINYGTQKLFSGTISANIGNNVKNYSIEDNTVVLTGTWISTDGTESKEIKKEINLKADWYGKTVTSPYDNINTSHELTNTIGRENITFSFSVGYTETAKELLIQKQLTEVKIPEFNGYDATEVKVTSQNCNYNFDEESKILTIERNASVQESGILRTTVSRTNTYDIQVKYPVEAYETLEQDRVNLTFPTTGYYYGYNNSSEEFSKENPYISKSSKDWTHTWHWIASTFGSSVGKYTYISDTGEYKYLISKEKVIKTYDGLTDTEENNEYTVLWHGSAGDSSGEQTGLCFTESKPDNFLTSSNEYLDMKEYVNVKAIYFSNIDNCLYDDGWIKVYDIDTGTLLTTFKKSNWNKYTESSPYYFEETVKGIKVETSKAKINNFMYVYQIKELNSSKVVTDFTYEQFENLNQICTFFTFGLMEGDKLSNSETFESRAWYEAPVSIANLTISPTAISNQENKKISINIETQTSRYNESKWKGGEFVIELPQEILEVEIENVTCDNSSVEITSYETYDENGKNYIKVYTNADKETCYSLNIDAIVAADSRNASLKAKVKLYAINQNFTVYRSSSRTEDILDINGNGNKTEFVLYREAQLQIMAPSSLVTSQTLSNYDDIGSEVVSPQVAILDKSNNKRDAKINVTLTNNYSRTISEVKVIGKIPFEGNTYQINGRDLGSMYSVKMKNKGIILPSEIADIAKVYYSTKEIVTENLEDTENAWQTADEVSDWSQIKTYVVDLSNFVFQKNQSLTFSYEIEIPEDLNYNDVSYSTHACYFCLDTEDGKLKTQTEVNRLGIMIAKKIDLNLVKYKSGTNRKVQGATYKIVEGTTAKTGITNVDGMATIKGLYVDKEYTLKEIKTPDGYLINEDEIKFKVNFDDEGIPSLELSGNIRDEATFSNNSGKTILNLNVEDIAKYDIKLLKKDSQTFEGIKGTKFKLTGGEYGDVGRIFTSNNDGEILITNLVPGENYILQETKANGYYLIQEKIEFSVSRDSIGNIVINSSNTGFSNASIFEDESIDKPIINVELTNDPISTYTLNVNNTNNKDEALNGSQFKLTSIDTGDVYYATTDENGYISFEGLYKFVEGKYITGEYILQEIVAKEGYVTDATEIKFKAEEIEVADEENPTVLIKKLNITILNGEELVNSSNSDRESILLNIVNKPIFKLTKLGDNDTRLENVKFKILDVDGNPVQDVNGNIIGEQNEEGEYFVTTDEKGELTADLPEGLYQVIEIETLEGYSLPDNEEDRTYYIGIGSNRSQETEFNMKWAKSITGSGHSNIHDMKPTEDGGYITVGSFAGECDFNGDGIAEETSKGNYDSFVAKFDQNGDYEWHYIYGTDGADEFYRIAVTQDGYIAVGYEDTANAEDAMIIKIDESGNQIWKTNLVGDLEDSLNSVEVLQNNDIVVTGRFYGSYINLSDTVRIENSTNYYSGFVACYDSNGEYKWHKELKATKNVNVTDVVETINGIAVSVDFGGELVIDENTITSKGSQDSVIIGYSTLGEYQWNQLIGGTNDETIADLATDNENNIIAVGGFSSDLLLGSETITPQNAKYLTGLMVKFAANGDYISNYTLVGTSTSGNDKKLTRVIKTSDNGLLLGGYTFEGLDLDKDGTIDITSKGNNDGIAIKLNEAGELEWYRIISGTLYDSVYGLAELKDNTYILAGNFSSDKISMQDRNDILTSNGYTDSFMINMGDIVTVAEIPQVQEIEVKNELKEFKITTEISENSEGKRNGGTVTGEETDKENIKIVEEVKYKYDSTKEITLVPDDGYSVYQITINGENYEFSPNDDGIVKLPIIEEIEENVHIKVIFEKNLSSVLVHHYLKDRSGNYTEISLAPDDYYTGRRDSKYVTSPRIDIPGYSLEKNEDSTYKIPSNSTGTYSDTQIIVNYYYEEIPYTLTVQHYLEGTENSLIESETYNLYKDEEYEARPSEKLLEKYNLIDDFTMIEPEIEYTSGTIKQDTVVTYYYKLKEYKITTEVKKHIQVDSLGVESEVIGGHIFGQTEDLYETVIINESNKKDIIVTADEGYYIKKLTIQNIYEDELVEENVELEDNVQNYTLSKFIQVANDINVIAEFDRIQGTVNVHHYLEGTTTQITTIDGTNIEDEIKTGYLGESYATKSKENEKFEVTEIPLNSSGKYQETPTEVIYYYKLREYSYKVNYLEKDTNEALSTAKVVESKIYGDEIIEEAIDIEGYDKVEPVTSEGIINSNNIEINFYYEKRSDLSYTVNYLEKDTKTVLHEAKVVNNQVYLSEVTENAIEITGYDKVDPVENKITINVSDNIINFYYEKRTDLSYTVNYLEKDTNTVLHEAKVVENQTYLSEITESAIDIAGYDKVDPVENKITINVSDNIINFYYEKRSDLSYTVNYLEKDTNKVLHEAKVVENQTYLAEITENAIDIAGYNKIDPTEAKITMDVDDNVISFYYEKKTDLSYTVNYLEKDTNVVLHEAKIVENQTYLAEITEKAIDIAGYNKIDPAEAKIIIDVDNNVINFYYEKRTDLSYTVRYLEKDTNQILHEAKIVNNQVYLSEVTEKAIDIAGYNKIDPTEAKITMDVDNNVINFYYEKRTDLSYTVNYLEKDTNKVLHEAKVVDGQMYLSEVTENAIDITGYDKVDPVENKITINVSDNIINFYYEKRTDLSYTVKYLEKDSNKELAKAKIVENQVFESEVIEQAIDIEGYNKADSTQVTIVIGVEENEIIFYYTKRSDLSYTVNYLEKDTNKELHEAKVVENQTYLAEITENAIDIAGYNKIDPTEVKITIDVDNNIINFYYEKRTDLSYTVRYLEKDTNKVLHEAKTVENQTYLAEVTEEAIEISGYSKLEPTEAKIIIDVDDNVISFYYEKKTDLNYTVNYLEKETNKVLHEAKVVENQTYLSEVTEEAIEISGYSKLEPTEAKITIDVGDNVINFYYEKRQDLSYIVNYLEKETDEVVHESKVVDKQTYLSTIIEAPIEIEGYNKLDEAKNIIIQVSDNVINFYYEKRQDLSYTVNYLEKDTDEVLHEAKTVGNQTYLAEITEEAIQITGYDKVEPAEAKITINVSDNIINFYYEKRTDLSYTVNYLEKYTNKVLSEAKIVENQTYLSEVTEEAIEITGYNKQDPTSVTIKIGAENNVINFYYENKNDLKYVVNYLEKDTNEILHEAKVVENQTYLSEVTETAITIEGYDKVDPVSQTITIQTENNIINFYYEKRKDLSYTVNYLEKDTNKILHSQKVAKNQIFGTVINTADEIIEINEYRYEESDKDTLTIGVEENVINIYYVRKEAKVIVKYLEKDDTKEDDTDNKVLLEDVVIDGFITKEYETEQKDIEGYTFVESTDNIKGTMTEEPIIVIYYYSKNTKVVVNYIDKNNSEKMETVEINGVVGDEFTSASKDFDGYVLIEKPEIETVTLTEEVIELNYYYSKVSAGVIEKHINIITKEVLYNELHEGNEGDEYSIESKEFEGYDLVEEKMPENAKGTMTVEPIEVVYYYARKTEVSVKYIDQITNEELKEKVTTEEGEQEEKDSSEVIKGYEGDEYETVIKEFKGYDLVEEKIPENAKGIMTVEPIEVVYYYARKTEVIVKHINKLTNEEIKEVVITEDKQEEKDSTEIIKGHEGDKYSTVPKEFEGYGLLKTTYPDNSEGTMTAETIEVIYYYARLAEVEVNYINKTTNEIIIEKVKDGENVVEKDSTVFIYGYEGDEYKTEEKVFEKYKLVEKPKNNEGTMEITQNEDGTLNIRTYVKYYYVKESEGVIERHIDLDTGKLLEEETKYKGYTGDEYTTKEKEFKGYNLVKDRYPENNKGTMKEEKIVVNYYYQKIVEKPNVQTYQKQMI